MSYKRHLPRTILAIALTGAPVVLAACPLQPPSQVTPIASGGNQPQPSAQPVVPVKLAIIQGVAVAPVAQLTTVAPLMADQLTTVAPLSTVAPLVTVAPYRTSSVEILGDLGYVPAAEVQLCYPDMTPVPGVATVKTDQKGRFSFTAPEAGRAYVVRLVFGADQKLSMTAFVKPTTDATSSVWLDLPSTLAVQHVLHQLTNANELNSFTNDDLSKLRVSIANNLTAEAVPDLSKPDSIEQKAQQLGTLLPAQPALTEIAQKIEELNQSSPTPSPSPTASPTASPTQAPTPSPTPTEEPTPSPSPTPSPTPDPTPTPTAQPTPTPTPFPGTSVSGALASSATTRWTYDKSPYKLTGAVTIPYGATLSIDPGVQVVGNGYDLNVLGVLSAKGNSVSRISVQGTKLVTTLNTTNTQTPFRLELGFVDMDGGALSNSSLVSYGSYSVTDSVIKNMGSIYLNAPTATSYFDRNKFQSMGGFKLTLKYSNSMYFRNNSFTGLPASTPALDCIEAASGAKTYANNNSFRDSRHLAIRFAGTYPSSRADITNNYWNTTAPDLIGLEMVSETVSGSTKTNTTYQPALTSDPNP